MELFSGTDIQNLRLIKKITQEGVAIKLGVTQQYYSKLEKKDWIDFETIERILNCLDASFEELIIIKKMGGGKLISIPCLVKNASSRASVSC